VRERLTRQKECVGQQWKAFWRGDGEGNKSGVGFGEEKKMDEVLKAKKL
jgi:hypothetical protein